jgi:hypothetical protein
MGKFNADICMTGLVRTFMSVQVAITQLSLFPFFHNNNAFFTVTNKKSYMPLVFKLIQRRGQRRIGCIGCSNEGWKMPNAAWFYMETVEERRSVLC